LPRGLPTTSLSVNGPRSRRVLGAVSPRSFCRIRVLHSSLSACPDRVTFPIGLRRSFSFWRPTPRATVRAALPPAPTAGPRAPPPESADQAGKIRYRYFGGKINARQTRSSKQLRKCALRLASFDRNVVDHQFATGNPQQKTAVPRLWTRRLQFVPGDFELAFR